MIYHEKDAKSYDMAFYVETTPLPEIMDIVLISHQGNVSLRRLRCV